VQFGKIENWILIGGEDLIIETAKFLRSKNQKFLIVTAKRNLDSLNQNKKSLLENFQDNDLDYYVSSNVNNDNYVLNKIDENTVALSLSSPWIFKKKFIDKLSNRLINLHEADLPQNRGAGTLSWMIMMRVKKSASVLHIVSAGVDEGDIISKSEYDFSTSLKFPFEYSQYILSKSLDLIFNFIENIIKNNKFDVLAQDNHLGSYWPRLNTKINGFINWEWHIEDLIPFIDAFDFYYDGSRSFINNNIVIIRNVCKVDERIKFHPFQYGIIYKKYNKGVYIAVKGGSLLINSISNDNGDNLYNDVRLGDRIFTPREKLELSLTSRPVYNHKGLKE
tara:strand:- start:137 stop:1141 length:1005 start_codon:yes stop_codon:yes gene_type:complete